MPRTSNPGPMLADEAGTLMVNSRVMVVAVETANGTIYVCVYTGCSRSGGLQEETEAETQTETEAYRHDQDHGTQEC